MGRWSVFWLLFGLAVFKSPNGEAATDDFVSKVWTRENGLPNNSVTSIAQTPDGYLWVGTYNGLVRFDGLNFLTFDPENTPALAHTRIRNLYLDKRGTLWINTFYGSLTSLRAGRFEREWTSKIPDDREDYLAVSSSNSVAFVLDRGDYFRKSLDAPLGTRGWEKMVVPNEGLSVLPYGNGGCVTWFNFGAMRLWRLTDNHFQPVPEVARLEGQGIKCVAPDLATGRLWVGTDKEIAILDGTNIFHATPTNGEALLDVRLIHPGEDGGVWVLANSRVRKMRDRRWVAEAETLRGLLTTNLTFRSAMLDDHKGGIWLFDYGQGVFHVNADGAVWQFRGPTGFDSRRVTSLMEDREGDIWAGFEFGGLVRIRASRFQKLDPDNNALTVARSVCEDSAGNLWTGSLGGGLGRWQNSSYTNFVIPGDFPNGSALSIYPDTAGRLWVSAGLEDLYVFENEKLKRVTPAVRGVKSILVDHTGRVWAGTRDGLYSWDGQGSMRFSPLDGLRQNTVRALAEDAQDAIWCGGRDGALYRITTNGTEVFSPTDISRTCAIWSLLAEPDGTIWAGTLGGGLLRFKDGKFTRYSITEGLPDNVISQILEDNAGNLWLGSNQGIVRVAKSQLDEMAQGRLEKLACTVFGRTDGLPSLECSGGYQPGAWRTKDGRLCFSTLKGAVSIVPSQVAPNLVPPKIILQEVLEDGIEIWPQLAKQTSKTVAPPLRAEAGEISGDKTNEARALLEIPAGRGRLEFRFAGLSLVAPERVQYRYQLEGEDDDWVEAGTRRFANYGVLSPGNYRFRVAGGNSDGIWSKSFAAINIEILPHYYETWWFRGLVVGALVVLVSGVARFRFNLKLRRQAEQMERQHVIDLERARIAKDIHDDLGSSLTLIAVMGDLAKHDNEGDRVGKISVTARQAVKSLDEIVWAVNPRNDTMAQLVDYMCGHAADYLGDSQIRCRLDVPDQMPLHEMSSKSRHHIFLAVKEVLQNVVKHSQAKEVSLQVSIAAGRLKIIISDNGRGFSVVPDDDLADGLRNISQRMSELGGTCCIQSQVGSGTEITLEYPFESKE